MRSMDLQEKVRERLRSLGCEVTDTDDVSLTFVISMTEQSIKNQCNLSEVPEELHYVLIDWACGEFLATKYGSGQLDLETLDLNGALASISEGDVSLSFDNSVSDEVKMQTLIAALKCTGKDELVCFRRLRW